MALPVLVGLATVLTSGCMKSLERPETALAIDPATTASITPLSADADIQSDEAAIAAAMQSGGTGARLPWSNPATGAAGVISEIADAQSASGPCKSFSTTRHGFDGIALYRGRACERPDGNWALTAFDRVGG